MSSSSISIFRTLGNAVGQVAGAVAGAGKLGWQATRVAYKTTRVVIGGGTPLQPVVEGMIRRGRERRDGDNSQSLIPPIVTHWLIDKSKSTALQIQANSPPSNAALATTFALQTILGDRQYHLHGRDLNPLHWGWQKLRSVPSSAPSPSSSSTPTVVPLDPPSSAAPAPAAPKPKEVNWAAMQIQMQDALLPENVKKYKKETQEAASKAFYPILSNYLTSFILFTLMGKQLDSDGKYNGALMACAHGMKQLNNGKFSLSIFKKILQNNGIQISTCQKIQLFFSYFMIAKIFGIIIPALCNHALDILYDKLFGNNGKDQAEVLENILTKLTSFLKNYLNNLKEGKLVHESNNVMYGKTLAMTLSELLKNDKQAKALFSSLAKMVAKNFAPSLSSWLNSLLVKLYRKIGIGENASNLAKAFCFLFTLPLRLVSLLFKLLETPIITLLSLILKNVGPMAVEETVKALKDPSRTASIQNNVLEFLKPPELEPNPQEDSSSSSPHGHNNDNAAEQEKICPATQSAKFQVALSKFIRQALPVISHLFLSDRTFEERAIKTACELECIQEQVAKRFLHPMISPLLANFLQPETLTNTVSFIMTSSSEAFAPSPPFTPQNIQQIEHDLKNEFKKLFNEESRKLMDNGITHLNTLLPNFQFPRVQLLPNPTPQQRKEEEKYVLNLEKKITTRILPILLKATMRTTQLLANDNFIQGAMLAAIEGITSN